MEEEEEIGPAQSLLGGTEHVEEEEEDRASSDPARRNRALKNKMSCCHAFRRYITYGEFLKFRTANPRNLTPFGASRAPR